ncbi:MAG: hypothetical protein UR22_C0022G0015, partial [Parcubacteria group bacterium GW2011_GWC2_32_10]
MNKIINKKNILFLAIFIFQGMLLFSFSPINNVIAAECVPFAFKACASGSVYWFDSCNNIHDIYQYCPLNQSCEDSQCKPVACSTNANCGTETTVGGSFCQGNYVFQKYNTPTCINPGQLNAYCSDVLNKRMIESCAVEQICSSGACITTQCSILTSLVVNFVNTSGIYNISYDVNCNGNVDLEDIFILPWLTEAQCDKKLNDPYNSCCQSHASKKCDGNSVYWYNSCGKKQELVETCTANQLCENAECKNVVCNTNANCGTNGLIDGLF